MNHTASGTRPGAFFTPDDYAETGMGRYKMKPPADENAEWLPDGDLAGDRADGLSFSNQG